jgi:hypothetical protein
MQQTYVDFLVQEWRIGEQSRHIQVSLRRVLGELCAESLLHLRRNPKLEVQFRPEAAGHTVWAYFRMHPRLRSAKVSIPKPGTMDELASAIRESTDDLYRRQLAAKKYKPKPATEVLLVLNPTTIEKQSTRVSCDTLRDHLGHTLLYLRDPKARNECVDAQKEWQSAAAIGA